MIFPPSLVYVRTKPKGIGVWLPVFLLWPFLLIFTLLLPLFLLIRALFGGGLGKAWRSFRSWLVMLYLFCRLREVRIEAVEPEKHFVFAVY